MRLARPGSIIFECMSLATFPEIDVKRNGGVKPETAIVPSRFVLIRQPQPMFIIDPKCDCEDGKRSFDAPRELWRLGLDYRGKN